MNVGIWVMAGSNGSWPLWIREVFPVYYGRQDCNTSRREPRRTMKSFMCTQPGDYFQGLVPCMKFCGIPRTVCVILRTPTLPLPESSACSVGGHLCVSRSFAWHVRRLRSPNEVRVKTARWTKNTQAHRYSHGCTPSFAAPLRWWKCHKKIKKKNREEWRGLTLRPPSFSLSNSEEEKASACKSGGHAGLSTTTSLWTNWCWNKHLASTVGPPLFSHSKRCCSLSRKNKPVCSESSLLKHVHVNPRHPKGPC